MRDVAFLSAGEIPLPRSAWLARTEQDHADTLFVPKRRREWLQGRLAAKLLLARELAPRGALEPLSRIEIRSSEVGAPEAYLDGQRLARPISISHRARKVLAATAEAGTLLGADCELVEERAPEVAETFLREDELALARRPQGYDALIVTLLWSAKESVLKALRLGLQEDTRKVSIRLGQEAPRISWTPFDALHETSGRRFEGLWTRRGPMILTLAAADEHGASASLLAREVTAL